MIHTDIYRNFNKEGFEFLLKRINIFYGKFTYLVIIKREGINLKMEKVTDLGSN